MNDTTNNTKETTGCTKIHTEYDDGGNVISEKYKNGNTTIQFFYDNNGKEIRRTIEHFDKNGNCVEILDHYKESDEYDCYTSFDSKGRKNHRMVNFNGKEEFYFYRKDGTLKKKVSVDSAGTKILYKYSKDGSLKNQRVLRDTSKKEDISFLSIDNMIKILWFYTIIGFLWQRIDILEFGQAQPAFSDSIFGLVLAIAITMALHFYKLSKANKTNNVVNVNIVSNNENTK